MSTTLHLKYKSHVKLITHSDHLQPSLAKVWSVALPLSGAMMSQAMLGLVDTALVGHLGGLALASVGIGSYLVFILVAALTGMGTGWHSLVAKSSLGASGTFVSGLVCGLALALILAALGGIFISELIYFLILDDRINSLAVHYADARLWALPAIALSIGARIYWSEQARPWQYTKFILASHVANVGISYVLIYGAFGLNGLGAVGAGIGTSIAVWLGVIAQFVLIMREEKANALIRFGTNLSDVFLLFRSSWPPILQQLAFSLHLAVFLYLVSLLGASAMAAAFAVLNVGLVMILPAVGLGQAAFNLIGSSHHTDPALALRWSRLIIGASAISAIILALIITYSASFIASLLVVNRELQLLTQLALPWYACAMILESLIIVLSRLALISGSHKAVFAISSSSQWLVFLPLLLILGPMYGFIAIWWVHIGYRMLVIIALGWIWRKSWLNRPLKISAIN